MFLTVVNSSTCFEKNGFIYNNNDMNNNIGIIKQKEKYCNNSIYENDTYFVSFLKVQMFKKT